MKVKVELIRLASTFEKFEDGEIGYPQAHSGVELAEEKLARLLNEGWTIVATNVYTQHLEKTEHFRGENNVVMAVVLQKDE